MKDHGHSEVFVPAGEAGDWMLWQLADSAFPCGGFAHSSGLEAAWQHGEVRNQAQLAGFLEASLWQFGYGSLPFFNAAYNEPMNLEALDRHCDSFLVNHVANRASRLQGRAFLASAERIFAKQQGRLSRPKCGHLAPVFGAVTKALALKHDGAARLFTFFHLRGLIAAAIRLGIVGPLEGQSLQHRLGPLAENILTHCRGVSLADAAQTSPLLEIWQGTQDRLYSRLFQS